jgi:hypothetical protein
VTYDLVKEETSDDYKPLIKNLKDNGGHRYQDSCWLVSLNNTAAQVYDHYNAMLDDNDKLFVAELVDNHKQGRNYKGTNDWIKNNPPKR